MSYQVLARKWRPRDFSQLVGQAHVVRALTNALDGDRVHQGFLFTGTRGVGKTTIARILAKCLNCERGVSSRPCGECSACREIDEGRHVDLIEVDAASRSKVDETRELMDNVQFTPARGRHKVYLIDEVHMFSDKSFNALLKTLEEPPPHVKFLLATTDPQKVPVTVLSRCLQFNLKRLPVAQIAGHLRHILEQETVAADAEAIREIARAAEGSMRDALSILDQAIAYGAGRVGIDEVREMLGALSREHVQGLLSALADRDAPGLMAQVDAMAADVVDFTQALGALLGALQRIALLQHVPEAIRDEPDEPDEREALEALAARLSPEDVQLFYQIALIGRRDLAMAPDLRGGMEMVLLRMLAFAPVTGAVPAAPGRSAGGSSTPASGARARAGTGRAASNAAAPQAGATDAGLADVAAPDSATPHPAPSEARTAPARVQSQTWPALIDALGLAGPVRALATHSQLLGCEDGVARFRIATGHEQLATNGIRDKLQAALSEHLGEPVRVRFEIGDPEQEIPADRARREAEARRQHAVEVIENDPNVQAMCDLFDGRVDRAAIRPTDE